MNINIHFRRNVLNEYNTKSSRLFELGVEGVEHWISNKI